MKPISVLFNKGFVILWLSIGCQGIYAQRDFSLTENRNMWLKSNNAAALVTFADSSISKASLTAKDEGGRYRDLSEGKNVWSISADARSYYRLNSQVVGYGSVTYQSSTGTGMYGSMLYKNPASLLPFDILQPIEDAGRKHLELFNIAGGLGWSITPQLSVGGKANFTAGNYSKYKDLRHANTLMNLETTASAFYALNKLNLGASFLYKRSTQTVKYKIYGTTDHVYKVLLDYANQQGQTITYGGDGFVDDNTELPLFDEQCGVSLQGEWKLGSTTSSRRKASVGLSFNYLHRNGYYGQQTQYTVSHEQHKGDIYDWQLRVNLPQSRNSLSWIDLCLSSEGLTSYKTNYRQVHSQENSSVIHYEYYSPTKMADKVLTHATANYALHLNPSGAIYLWNLNMGAQFLHSQQTAYLYPQTFTRKVSLFVPYLNGKRNIVCHRNSILAIQLGAGAHIGNMDIMIDGMGPQVHESLGLSYEFPFLSVRPNIGLNYSCAQSSDTSYPSFYRHVIRFSLGVMF